MGLVEEITVVLYIQEHGSIEKEVNIQNKYVIIIMKTVFVIMVINVNLFIIKEK